MRAVVVTEYGGRAEAVELPAPEAQAGQVLIKVLAAGMNPMDGAIVDAAATQSMFSVPDSIEIRAPARQRVPLQRDPPSARPGRARR